MSKHNWRIILTAILVVLACIAFWNTFKLWTMSDTDRDAKYAGWKDAIRRTLTSRP